LFVGTLSTTNAFTPPHVNGNDLHRTVQPKETTTTVSSSSLDAAAFSAWNLNRDFGASPFGFDINAEVWNGRIAQVK
jgi:hypothetical protein